jgi:predicted dehydrogenase
VVPGAGDDLRIEAYGTRGMLVFDTQNPNILEVVEITNGTARRQHIATLSQTQPAAALPRPETPTGVLQWHLASISSFLTALGTNTRPRPDFDDGLQVDRVIEAAARSAKQGGAPISL